MRGNHPKIKHSSLVAAIVALLLAAGAAQAQTSTITYQGRLTEAGAQANGAYDMQFALFDSPAGGTQTGATQTVTAVTVSDGVFTVRLDFGAGAFSGENRFLEIGVRPASAGGSFALLSPRQQISSTPYAIRTLSAAVADTATNATQLGGVAASQYVQTTDARLSDTRQPAAGSSNYIQNTTSPQAGASFNVGGSGAVGTLDVGGALSLRPAPAAPPAAPPGQGRVYYDSASNKIKVSQNGDAFVDLIGAGGVSGSGGTGTIPRWSASNVLDNSVITQTAAGNVGINTTSAPAFRLEVGTGTNSFGFVHTGTLFGPGGQTLTTRVGSFVGGNPFGGWFGTLSDDPLYFFTQQGSAPAVTITRPSDGGNVGIGTTAPQAKLDVAGGARVGGALSVGGGAAVNGLLNVNTQSPGYGLLQTAGTVQVGTYAGAGQTNPAGGWFGTKSNHPLYFFTADSAAELTLTADGNLNQPRDRAGLAKAMIRVDTGQIVRCYNGITNDASGSCGFSVVRFQPGVYKIDFNFSVRDRFISVTPFYSQGYALAVLDDAVEDDSIFVDTILHNSTDPSDAPFYIIVF